MAKISTLLVSISIHTLKLKIELMKLIEITTNGLRWLLKELLTQESFQVIELFKSIAKTSGRWNQLAFLSQLKIQVQE